MNNRQIGEALDSLTDDVKRHARELVSQYRAQGGVGTIRQAADTPHRARAQVQAWMSGYGAGAAAFLNQCLTAAGSTKTLAQIDAALAALETQAATLVTNVAQGWTWDQVADAIELAIPAPSTPQFSYASLPIPQGYVTIWGSPW